MNLVISFFKLNIYLLLFTSVAQINTTKAMDFPTSKEESLSENSPKKKLSYFCCGNHESSEEENILTNNLKEIKKEDNFWEFLVVAKDSSGIWPIQ
jgi:hypothetical protein